MADTQEEGPFPATTPQDKQRCTRLTGCQKAECLTCNQPGTRTNHIRNLSQELGNTPPPKKLSKPRAPADHIISTLTEDFEQAFLDNEAEDIKACLHHYGLSTPDFLKFDRSILTKHVATARKLVEPKSLPPPVPATTPTSPLLNLKQSV